MSELWHKWKHFHFFVSSFNLASARTHTRTHAQILNLPVLFFSPTLLQRGWSPFLHQMCLLKAAQPLFFFHFARSLTYISLCDMTWWIYDFNHRHLGWGGGFSKKKKEKICSDMKHINVEKRVEETIFTKGLLSANEGRKYSSCWNNNVQREQK